MADVSTRRLGVDPGTVHVSFMVDVGAQRRNFLRFLWFFTLSTVPPLLHTLLHFNTALTTRTSKRTVENLEKIICLFDIRELWTGNFITWT